jgi:hypothetical protein
MLGWFLADILVSLDSIDEEFSLPSHSSRISLLKSTSIPQGFTFGTLAEFSRFHESFLCGQIMVNNIINEV